MKSAWVFDATEKDFEEKVLKKSSETPVVVDFWAPWCGPCRSLGPIIEKLVSQRNGEVLLAKVNIDEEQQLAVQFNVQSIPLVVGIRDGKAVSEFLGLVSERQMVEFLDRLKPSQAEQLAKQAKDLEATNPVEAERVYRQALKDDPEQEQAVLGLCRLLLKGNNDSEAAERLERFFPTGQNVEEKERLLAMLWLRRQANDSGDEATLQHQVELDPKNANALFDLGCVKAASGDYETALKMMLQAGELDQRLARSKVKEAMVKVFHVLGVRNPISDDYRDRLASILY